MAFDTEDPHHTEALADEGAEPSFSLGFRTDGAYLL